jgi:HAE1 family hydrophobic/amphiphilic exporter-1
VPTFYDSIEIARDRAKAKYRRRAIQWNPFVAFVLTFIEALLTLTLLRFVFRMRKRLEAWSEPRGAKPAGAGQPPG